MSNYIVYNTCIIYIVIIIIIPGLVMKMIESEMFNHIFKCRKIYFSNIPMIIKLSPFIE